MSKNCVWPDCQNIVVFGDKSSETEFGDMCPYHKAMIVMYNRIPPVKPKSETEPEAATEVETKK